MVVNPWIHLGQEAFHEILLRTIQEPEKTDRPTDSDSHDPSRRFPRRLTDLVHMVPRDPQSGNGEQRAKRRSQCETVKPAGRPPSASLSAPLLAVGRRKPLLFQQHFTKRRLNRFAIAG